MSLSFEDVYRVSNRLRLIPGEHIEALAHDLGLELAIGYRDYLTTLGKGELCDLLRVHTPEHVREELTDEFGWRREAWLKSFNDGRWKPCALTAADLAEAVTFASSAEGDHFICCTRFGPVLFELPRHSDVITELTDGFYGAVGASSRTMGHDFPFFDTWDREQRWHRVIDVGPEFGIDGFIEKVMAHWGKEGFRQSRRSLEEHANIFVRAIGGQMVLTPASETALPPGSIKVGMVYDKEWDHEVQAFVDDIALAGSEPPWQSPWQD